MFGDSGVEDQREPMRKLIAKLDDVLLGRMKVHLIFDDPAGNSYVQVPFLLFCGCRFNVLDLLVLCILLHLLCEIFCRVLAVFRSLHVPGCLFCGLARLNVEFCDVAIMLVNG